MLTAAHVRLDGTERPEVERLARNHHQITLGPDASFYLDDEAFLSLLARMQDYARAQGIGPTEVTEASLETMERAG